MDENGLQLGSPQWLPIAAIMAIACLLSILWSYGNSATRAEHWSGSRLLTSLLAVCLKTIGCLALCVCLLNPLWRSQRPVPGANIFATVVDNSASMTIGPGNGMPSLAQTLQREFASAPQWETRLAQDFDYRRYAFAENITQVDSIDELNFQANSALPVNSLNTLFNRFAKRPIAGVLLFTDGFSELPLEEIQLLGDIPIFPVINRTDSEIKDVAIVNASATTSDFELSPTTVSATVTASSLPNQSIQVRLISPSGKTVEQQELRTNANGSLEQKVRFQYKPENVGLEFVTLRAMLASEDREPLFDDQNPVDGPAFRRPLHPSTKREATSINNQVRIAIKRVGGPFRVLYAAGRPNWEFKFLRRALDADPEVKLVGLIRIAKEEPKFSFRDQGLDTSNPLLTGFSDSEAEEQYDEPVLKVFGAESEAQLSSGFPSVAEELFSYHAIILDDIEAKFFNQTQQLLIREFVSKRGGGLMMLGGQETFSKGGYRGTPLGDVLPIYTSSPLANSRTTNPSLRPQLTLAGNLEPWLRLRATQNAENERQQKTPTCLASIGSLESSQVLAL